MADLYYKIQSALMPHMVSSTELLSAMSTIWPLIDDAERANVRLRQALRDIEEMPFSSVNDSESLRHSIRTMQTIARTAAQAQS